MRDISYSHYVSHICKTVVNTAFIHLHFIPNMIEICTTITTQHITYVTNMEKYTRMHSSKI